MLTVVKETCTKCLGNGTVDRVSPASLRKARLTAGISLRTMALRIGISAPYLVDIELGRRGCPDKVLKAYDKL